MTQQTWTAVDDYFSGALLDSDPALDALAAATAAGLPAISVSPLQGKFLNLLARMIRARNILEVGTLGGYSTIWMAKALPPGGRAVTLEIDAKHADVAQKSFAKAGLAKTIQLHLGPALETLPKLEAEGGEPFDLVFIDADKPNNPNYFEWALKLTRAGSVIVVDNVVRSGNVADPKNHDAGVEGVRKVCELIAANPRVDATAIQTTGLKGYDGFIIALVTADP
ncbi:MAG TPA: O-methyltransferase [Rhizomicrobium sp.]|jgi:predicted O-methyltransferase YrrM|nr:O-methyltransferase [Rhizomicrobium sp.]